MAIWDNAFCLAQAKLLSGRNNLSSDASMGDPTWYLLLTEAESHWKPKLASEYPYHMFTTPTLMSTSDSGVTWTFGTDTAPLAVEVYAALNGERLIAGQFNDPGADYTWEGTKIRMTSNTIRSFSGGAPYARWVAGPVVIDASTQPTMLPVFTRRLIVHRAVILWASRGGMRDASPFEKLENNAWDEIQVSLKQSNPFYGDAANRGRRRVSGIAYLLGRR